MLFENVSLVGVTHVDAPHRITSHELEAALEGTYARLGMPERMLESLTGVRARRFWDASSTPSEAATSAGRKVLRASGVDPERVGLLINTSVCRDYVEPSVACFVHHNLGLADTCQNFDLSNACLGFINGMIVAAHMLERGEVDYALIVDAESSRFVSEATVERLSQPSCDRTMLREQLATLTVGSGAAAALLARTSVEPNGHAFLGGVSLAATRHNLLCRGTESTGLTDTSKLLAHGVELAARTWTRAQALLGWDADSTDFFALHQVSSLHAQELAKALGFPLSKSLLIYPEFGNVGPASVPIVLSKALEAERIHRGDRVVLGGIGSGLNCMAVGVLW